MADEVIVKSPKNNEFDKARFCSMIQRLEVLDGEINDLKEDRKDLMKEAKGAGFNVKVIQHILKLRKMSAAQREEEEFLTEAYKKAIDLS